MLNPFQLLENLPKRTIKHSLNITHGRELPGGMSYDLISYICMYETAEFGKIDINFTSQDFYIRNKIEQLRSGPSKSENSDSENTCKFNALNENPETNLAEFSGYLTQKELSETFDAMFAERYLSSKWTLSTDKIYLEMTDKNKNVFVFPEDFEYMKSFFSFLGFQLRDWSVNFK
jgi:hypothetical protein